MYVRTYILTNVSLQSSLQSWIEVCLGVVRSWLLHVMMFGKKSVGYFTRLLIGP